MGCQVVVGGHKIVKLRGIGDLISNGWPSVFSFEVITDLLVLGFAEPKMEILGHVVRRDSFHVSWEAVKTEVEHGRMFPGRIKDYLLSGWIRERGVGFSGKELVSRVHERRVFKFAVLEGGVGGPSQVGMGWGDLRRPKEQDAKSF